jgi:tetratricopeptide (TPR) repeat protein
MTRSWYAIILGGTGERAAALREARHAYELDPFAVVVAGAFAEECYLSRDDACANEITRRIVNLGGHFYAYTTLAKLQAQRGQPDSAVAALRAAMALVQRPDRLLANLAYVQAKAGRVTEARETLRRAVAAHAEPFEIASAFAALHEPDSVFAWFDRTPWQWTQRGSLDDRVFDDVRSDPRFPALRARIHREMGVR